ncbi:ABC transporter permease [Actinomadura macrotermitis]|uniref:ABC transporter permease n=1 Tax=Actinomadura macrotermitis TaxID=2585200 RepID=A0A7K0BPB3_9ACTN|nr:ABC transporter permease [Actinomadura macrotermitis]MQY03040.1 hypothetical protein [Actinomadura macrotermitis]
MSTSFFLLYLRRELLRRKRQAVVIALGLAVGVGLVVTVGAATDGVQKAQVAVLHGLYGIGTDLTVTTAPPKSDDNSKVVTPTDTPQHHDFLGPSMGLGVLDAAKLADIARVPGVQAAAGGLTLTNTKINLAAAKDVKSLPIPTSTTVNGLDVAHQGLGPYASVKIDKGRSFTGADAAARVAVVDSAWAAANKVKVGSVLVLANKRFTVIGLAGQGQNAPNIYVPLGPAQALSSFQSMKTLAGRVTTIYVKAANGAALDSVQKNVTRLVPGATVTSSSNLAGAVSGSLASAAGLAKDLGRWLAIASMAAAFLMASLLTLAAVTRRVREFGTLKAIGWRSRQIVLQLMGEALITGIIGAALGVALGFAGSALVEWLAPELRATVAENPGSAPPEVSTISGGGVNTRVAPGSTHTVAVHLTAPMTLSAILLAVLLAIAGGLVAGSFGGWRAARLRPAEALGRVA